MVKNIFYTVLLITAVFLLVLFNIESYKDNPKTILKNVLSGKSLDLYKTARPVQGEKLHYVMKYLWVIPVAKADIEIKNTQLYEEHIVYPLIASGQTCGIVSSFVKAGGSVKSFVDINQLYPWYYEERAQAEGHSPSQKSIRYNQDKQIMEFEAIKRRIPQNTHDPLSALFYLRWQDYSKDSDIKFAINSNQENYPLETKLLGSFDIEVNGLKKNIIKTCSILKSHKEFSKSEADITSYILNDSSRLPLLLKIKTKFGPITVRLTGVEYK